MRSTAAFPHHRCTPAISAPLDVHLCTSWDVIVSSHPHALQRPPCPVHGLVQKQSGVYRSPQASLHEINTVCTPKCALDKGGQGVARISTRIPDLRYPKHSARRRALVQPLPLCLCPARLEGCRPLLAGVWHWCRPTHRGGQGPSAWNSDRIGHSLRVCVFEAIFWRSHRGPGRGPSPDGRHHLWPAPDQWPGCIWATSR
mmetsp:Transcript_56973/g.101716  ORF Transcript_56973/g.101716 Transcript_56973/m.101716 type:complete len:200 (-) Transcript_56973:181-780(-)